MSIIIAPSILSADFAKLGDEVADVLSGGAQWIHVDVMDGQFVPNITMGPLIVDAIRRRFTCPLDVHLMIEAPERFIEDFARAGATTLTIHAESTPHVHRALQQIRNLGIRAGLAFNPATPLEMLSQVVDDVDLVLLMTVNPGFGGQTFIPSVLTKIERARKLLNAAGRTEVDVEIDGGVSEATIYKAKKAGANVFVAGSAIFGATDRTKAIHNLFSVASEAMSKE